MPKKTTTTAQQRARQEQWRRRVDAQVGGGGAATRSMAEISAEDAGALMDGGDGYQQAEMRQMPAAVTTTGAATRAVNRTGGTAAMPSAGQRRAFAATRAARTRIAVNTISLEEEMHFVRADIRKLITLTVACLVIIIVLAVIINNFL